MYQEEPWWRLEELERVSISNLEGSNGLRLKKKENGKKRKREREARETERKWLNKREMLRERVMDGESDEEGGRERGRRGEKQGVMGGQGDRNKEGERD